MFTKNKVLNLPILLSDFQFKKAPPEAMKKNHCYYKKAERDKQNSVLDKTRSSQNLKKNII